MEMGAIAIAILAIARTSDISSKNKKLTVRVEALEKEMNKKNNLRGSDPIGLR